MIIRICQDKDYKHLVKLYTYFFSTHNIFSGNEKNIIQYLKTEAKENKLLVLEENSAIKGALYLVNFGQNANRTHTLWKFRHFAFDSKDTFSQLIQEAEKRVKNASKTAKIELTIAENEKGINYYKLNGYAIEGTLSHHYRFGETCFIFAKSFS